jgi:hypothetical protein
MYVYTTANLGGREGEKQMADKTKRRNTSGTKQWGTMIEGRKVIGNGWKKLSGAVELDVRDRPRLEPAFERNDRHDPSEGETRDCDSQARDHHDVVPTLPHRCHSQVGCAKHEHQTATRQEESSQGFGGRSARQSRTGRPQPQEEVSQTSHDREPSQQVPPQRVYLNLENIRLEVGGHRDPGDSDADSGERIERGDV